VATPEQTLRTYLDALRRDSIADIRALCDDAIAQDHHDMPSSRGPNAPDDMALVGRNLLGRYCVVYCEWINSGKTRLSLMEYLVWSEDRKCWLFTGALPISHVFQTIQNCSNFPGTETDDFSGMLRVPLVLGPEPEVQLWEPPAPHHNHDHAPATGTRMPSQPDCYLLARITKGEQGYIEDTPGETPARRMIADLREAFATNDQQAIRILWTGTPYNPVPKDFLGWSSDFKAKTRVVGVLGHPQGEIHLLESYQATNPGPTAVPVTGQTDPVTSKRHYGALFWKNGAFVSAIEPLDQFSDINQLFAKTEFWQALAKACAQTQ
jgi:hypothetical protein